LASNPEDVHVAGAEFHHEQAVQAPERHCAVHDLLRTGQLGSVKAGRRRLIAKHHLEPFLAG